MSFSKSHTTIFCCLLFSFIPMLGMGQNELLSDTTPKVENSLLALPFNSVGMTESTAKTYSSLLAQNLINTNRFGVTGPEGIDEELEGELDFDNNPADASLLGCRELGCGLQIATRFQNDWILTGDISLTSNQGFILQVELVNVTNNRLEFEDVIRFQDNNRDQKFYQLAERIADNTPIIGKILQANSKIAIISLGKRDGLNINDKLVVYKENSPEYLDTLDEDRKKQEQNIAIINLTTVGQNTSQVSYFQAVEIPLEGQLVKTYLSRLKQIEMLSEVRKELDTYERHAYDIVEEEIVPVPLVNEKRLEWERQVRFYEERRDLFQLLLVGAGVSTAYVAYTYSADANLQLGLALGATAWTAYEYLSNENKIEELVEEGKFRGFLEITPTSNLDGASIGVRFHF